VNNIITKMPSLRRSGTLFIALCSISAILGRNWSDRSGWASNRVPTSNTQVTINSGETVVIDTNANAGRVIVRGTLRCDSNKDTSIQADMIIVEGSAALFECGTASNPHRRKFEVILVGPTGGDPSEGRVIQVDNNAK